MFPALVRHRARVPYQRAERNIISRGFRRSRRNETVCSFTAVPLVPGDGTRRDIALCVSPVVRRTNLHRKNRVALSSATKQLFFLNFFHLKIFYIRTSVLFSEIFFLFLRFFLFNVFVDSRRIKYTFVLARAGNRYCFIVSQTIRQYPFIIDKRVDRSNVTNDKFACVKQDLLRRNSNTCLI